MPLLSGCLIAVALAAPAQAEPGPESAPEAVEAPAEGTSPSEAVAPSEAPSTETVAPAETPAPTEAPVPAEAPASESVAPAETPAPTEAPVPAEAPPTETRGEAKPTEPPTVRGGEVSGTTPEHEHAALTGAAGSGGPPSSPQPVEPAAPTGSEIVTLGGQPGPDEGTPPAMGGRPAERRAAQRSCELSILGGPASACGGGWATSAVLASAAPGSAMPVSAEAVLAIANGPGGDDHNDSGGGSAGGRPVGPAPEPAPGGAAGGGVAGGSSGGGVGLAGFLTIAALLLLAAPRALRRLRLSCRPYRTAFFVLIPERPG